MNHPEIIIGGSVTVCDAMRLIDRSEIRILFVKENGKLKGSLTDGDIRRYLYKEGKTAARTSASLSITKTPCQTAFMEISDNDNKPKEKRKCKKYA